MTNSLWTYDSSWSPRSPINTDRFFSRIRINKCRPHTREWTWFQLSGKSQSLEISDYLIGLDLIFALPLFRSPIAALVQPIIPDMRAIESIQSPHDPNVQLLKHGDTASSSATRQHEVSAPPKSKSQSVCRRRGLEKLHANPPNSGKRDKQSAEHQSHQWPMSTPYPCR